MQFDFETSAYRCPGNLKRTFTPQCIAEKGYASFAGAEMDFPTAPALIQSVVECAQNGLFGFTLPDETYLESIVKWMKRERNTQIQPEWIVPMMGTIYSTASLIRLVCGPEDAIITLTPVYYRYEQAAARLGRKTLHCELIESKNGYRVDWEQLEKLMAEETSKLLILCNPHNPVGKIFDREELRKIAELSGKYGVYVLSDEIFAEITFDGKEVTPYIADEIFEAEDAGSDSICVSCEKKEAAGWRRKARKYALTVTSLGKAFNLTGVNQANLIIPDQELRERVNIQKYADHFGSIDPLFYAALKGAYTEEGSAWLVALREHVDKNRQMLYELAAKPEIPFSVFPVEGSFVAWLKWDGLDIQGEKLREFLVNELYLDLESGEEYGEGYAQYTRMNLAATGEQFRMACERISECFTMKVPDGGHMDGVLARKAIWTSDGQDGISN